jgi:hypothetical protein
VREPSCCTQELSGLMPAPTPRAPPAPLPRCQRHPHALQHASAPRRPVLAGAARLDAGGAAVTPHPSQCSTPSHTLDPSPWLWSRARKVLGQPKGYEFAHALMWEYIYKRLELAQLPGQLGVFLTWQKSGALSREVSKSTGSAYCTTPFRPPTTLSRWTNCTPGGNLGSVGSECEGRGPR